MSARIPYVETYLHRRRDQSPSEATEHAHPNQCWISSGSLGLKWLTRRGWNPRTKYAHHLKYKCTWWGLDKCDMGCVHIHMSYFLPLVPLFWISSDVSSGFQSQSGFTLICIVEGNVLCIPWDPPLVLHIADILTDSIAGHWLGIYLLQEYYWVSYFRCMYLSNMWAHSDADYAT